MDPTPATSTAVSSPAFFVLKAYGDVDRLDTLSDLDAGEARIVEQDARWTIEVVIRANGLAAAEELGQEIVNEASFDLGTWQGWHVSPGLTTGATA